MVSQHRLQHKENFVVSGGVQMRYLSMSQHKENYVVCKRFMQMTHRPKFRKDKAGMCLFRRITGVFLAATLLLPAGVYLSPGNPFGFSAQAATEDDSGLNTHVIDTISPSHVKFNLFDYWVNQKSSGANDGWSSQGGINADHR